MLSGARQYAVRYKKDANPAQYEYVYKVRPDIEYRWQKTVMLFCSVPAQCRTSAQNTDISNLPTLNGVHLDYKHAVPAKLDHHQILAYQNEYVYQ